MAELKDFVKHFEDNLKEAEELTAKLDLLRTSKKEMEEEVAAIASRLQEENNELSRVIAEKEAKLAKIRDDHFLAMSKETERVEKVNRESDEKKDAAVKLLDEAAQRTNVLDESIAKFNKDYINFERERSDFNIAKHQFEEDKTLVKMTKDKCEQDKKQIKEDLRNIEIEKTDIAKAQKSLQDQAQANIIKSKELTDKEIDIESKIATNNKLIEEISLKREDFKKDEESHKTKQAYLNRLSDNLKAKEANLNKLTEEAAFNIAKAQKREQEAEEKMQELAFELAKLKKKEK